MVSQIPSLLKEAFSQRFRNNRVVVSGRTAKLWEL